MYKFWQRIKPFIRLLFGSEETFSFVKENVFLVSGFLFNRPIVYRHQLPTLLNFLHLTGEGVEVGVRDGAYSEIILHYGDLFKLYSVDPWREFSKDVYNDGSNVEQKKQDELYEYTKKRLEQFGARSEILRKTSGEAAPLFKDNSLDFVYIDANHSYEAVQEDIALWWPKLKEGGVFAGHDYVNGLFEPQGLFGVKRAVDEFAKTNKQKVYKTPEKWPTWYVVKNDSVRHRSDIFQYGWREVSKHYKNTSLWRQTRGIR